MRLLKLIFKIMLAHLDGLKSLFISKEIKIKLNITKNTNVENDLKLCDRIFKFYKEMKKHEPRNSPYGASSQWKDHIDKDFYPIKFSLENNDVKVFKNFLNNFGNWDKYLGIEEHTFLQKCNKNFLLRSYLKNFVFLKQYKLWSYLNSHKKKPIFLSTPKYGNQIGALIEGKYFATLASFSNEIISTNLINLLNKINKPVVAELGAGYGQMAYFMIKQKNMTFIDIDIPETLCLSAYYLMKCFPKKKVFLFGEKNLNSKKINQYDLVFLPYFKADILKKSKVDLFINKNSLGEMYPKTVKAYMKVISLCARYFFHMNHSVFKNKFSGEKKGLLSDEYPISKNFQLLSKYPDISHLIWLDGKVHYENDIFCYLYKKDLN